MVEHNPEEEKKEVAGAGGAAVKRQAPQKSINDICQILQDCVIDAGNYNIDFMNYLCDQALNFKPG